MSGPPVSQRYSTASLSHSSQLPSKPVSSRLSSATSLSFSSAYNGAGGAPSFAGSSTTAGGYANASASHAPPQQSILDRPLNKTKGQEVSLSAFAFLLAEVISYSQSRVDSVNDLERRYVSIMSCFPAHRDLPKLARARWAFD